MSLSKINSVKSCSSALPFTTVGQVIIGGYLGMNHTLSPNSRHTIDLHINQLLPQAALVFYSSFLLLTKHGEMFRAMAVWSLITPLSSLH